VTPSERANLPRWRGEPGFFEIWFLVVFEPAVERAWWLRYTTFAPAGGGPGEPRTTLWAAAFDARAAEPAVAAKWGPGALVTTCVAPGAAGELRVEARAPTRRLTARAWCHPSTLVGYVYGDPGGFDLHVAQSDLASCEGELRTRAHPFAPWGPPRILTATHAAAIEFHHPEPLPGVRYIAWDDAGR
jgi:hypothetical protein